jgi:hypothetical protein
MKRNFKKALISPYEKNDSYFRHIKAYGQLLLQSNIDTFYDKRRSHHEYIINKDKEKK